MSASLISPFLQVITAMQDVLCLDVSVEDLFGGCFYYARLQLSRDTIHYSSIMPVEDSEQIVIGLT